MTDFIPNPLNYTPRYTPPPKQAMLSDVVARPNLTDDELRTMAREKLSALLQSIDPKTSPSLLLSVAREVMDRIEGKPTQRIEQKVEHSSKGRADEMSNEQLMLVLQRASIAGLLPAGMALKDDGMLVTDAEYQEVATTIGSATAT